MPMLVIGGYIAPGDSLALTVGSLSLLAVVGYCF